MFVATLATVAATALGVAGCGDSGSIATRPTQPRSTSAPATALTITVRADATTAPRTVTLTCGPAGGTHPDPAKACAALARVPHPFAPLRRRVACTEIYGGPQLATVTGRYQGKPVHTDFQRSNGCEIARWDAIAALFPIEVGVGR